MSFAPLEDPLLTTFPVATENATLKVDNVIVLSDDDDDLDSGSLKNEPPRDLIKNTKKQKKVATAPQDDDRQFP